MSNCIVYKMSDGTVDIHYPLGNNTFLEPMKRTLLNTLGVIERWTEKLKKQSESYWNAQGQCLPEWWEFRESIELMADIDFTEQTAHQLHDILFFPKNAVSSRLTTTDKLPLDRIFRALWTDDMDTDTVDIDYNKLNINNLGDDK